MAKRFYRFLPFVCVLFLGGGAFAGEPILFSSAKKRAQPAPVRLDDQRAKLALERLSSQRPFDTSEAPPLTSSSRPNQGRRPSTRKEKEKAESKQDWMGLDKDELRDRTEDTGFLEMDDGEMDEQEAPTDAAEAVEARRPGRTPQQFEPDTSDDRIPKHILSPTQRQAREKKVAVREGRPQEPITNDDPTGNGGKNNASLTDLDLPKLLATESSSAMPEKLGGVTLRDFLGPDRSAAPAPESRNKAAFNAMLNQTLQGSTTAPGGPGDLGAGSRTTDPINRSTGSELNPLRPDPSDTAAGGRGFSRSPSLPEMPKLIPEKPSDRELRGFSGRAGEDPRRDREIREMDRDNFRKARGLR